jgi:hypothetical protein
MSRRRRRPLSRTAVVALIVVGWGASVGTVLALQHRSDRLPNPRRVVVRVSTPSGIRVDRGRLVVDSLDAWRDFASDAIEDGLRLGMRDAVSVLAHVMRRALPRLAWPPRSDSSLWPQWKLMLKDTSELLHFEPDPLPEGAVRPLLGLVR